MSGRLMWAGLPVSIRLVLPRYQVVVDEIAIGEVQLVAGRLWTWHHYDSRRSGSNATRLRAARDLLAAHSRMVDEFATTPKSTPEATRG